MTPCWRHAGTAFAGCASHVHAAPAMDAHFAEEDSMTLNLTQHRQT